MAIAKNSLGLESFSSALLAKLHELQAKLAGWTFLILGDILHMLVLLVIYEDALELVLFMQKNPAEGKKNIINFYS